jgi:hypothetical protein
MELRLEGGRETEPLKRYDYGDEVLNGKGVLVVLVRWLWCPCRWSELWKSLVGWVKGD